MSSKSGPDPTSPAPSPKPRQAWSLAFRLTAWYAGTSFLVVLLATGILYRALVNNLEREDDEELAERVELIRAALQSTGTTSADASAVLSAYGQGKFQVRLADEEGRTVIESPGMGETLPHDLFPQPPGGIAVHQGDGKHYRLLAVRIAPRKGSSRPWVVHLSLDCSPEEQLLRDYRKSLWPVLGLALAVCTVAGHQIARRGIRPVQEIAMAARRICPTTLNERITADGFPAELSGLVSTFNGMLTRLEEAFARLAQFSSNIAHELRTPIAALRGGAEVALARPRSADEYRQVIESSLEECMRLTRLIDGLLFLARSEDPRTRVERERIDVGRELAAIWELYEAAAADAGARLVVVAAADLPAEVNRPLFQRAVGNLVDNALKHTPSGGTINLACSREGKNIRVEVADTGCGIAADHLSGLFERFYRVDRSSRSAGVGLGLAIVRSIAELHGGSVTLESEVGRGTRVVLLLPARGPAVDG
jgi:two-component system heavy metal sensor histidine kinase CusS